METLQNRPQFYDKQDQIERCPHGWPHEIAVCPKCEWEREAARMLACPKLNWEFGQWDENQNRKRPPGRV